MGRKVVRLAQATPAAALAGLNRLTGLKFSSWPESLVNPGAGPGRESAQTSTDEREETQTAGVVARAQGLSRN